MPKLSRLQAWWDIERSTESQVVLLHFRILEVDHRMHAVSRRTWQEEPVRLCKRLATDGRSAKKGTCPPIQFCVKVTVVGF